MACYLGPSAHRHCIPYLPPLCGAGVAAGQGMLAQDTYISDAPVVPVSGLTASSSDHLYPTRYALILRASSAPQTFYNCSLPCIRLRVQPALPRLVWLKSPVSNSSNIAITTTGGREFSERLRVAFGSDTAQFELPSPSPATSTTSCLPCTYTQVGRSVP